MSPELAKSIGIIGGGCSGLVLANRLLVDGAPDKALTLYDDERHGPTIFGAIGTRARHLRAPRAGPPRIAGHIGKSSAMLARAPPCWEAVAPAMSVCHHNIMNNICATPCQATIASRWKPPPLQRMTRFWRTTNRFMTPPIGRPCGDGLVQHFQGVHVTAAQPCFDPQVATLMDFRVDQSRGVHFIYMLPFSPTHALVESTLFSPQPCEAAFYQTAISDYLARHFPSITFSHGADGKRGHSHERPQLSRWQRHTHWAGRRGTSRLFGLCVLPNSSPDRWLDAQKHVASRSASL